jgi:hypothetical protein
MKNLSKKIKLLLLITLGLLIAGVCYICYIYDEHVVECQTENFYYIYGILDEDTCILLKPVSKLSEEEVAELGDEAEGLIMVDTVISDEAKKNYMFSATNMDIYGLGNTYLYEAGIGPFKHQYTKVKDVLYLTNNTAKKVGLMEGEPDYDYGTISEEEMEELMSATPSDASIVEMEPVESSVSQ